MQAGAPTSESQRDQDWSVRTDAVHVADDPLPAGGYGWTDYRDHDRRLTRNSQHPHSRPVYVVEPLMSGDRVRVTETAPGSGNYEARQW